MKKYHHGAWLRSVSTTQEKRYNGKRFDPQAKYVRAKRRANNLPDAWDDIPCCQQKTWKHKRKTQYRPLGRKANYYHFILDTDGWINEWYIEEYFEKNNIAYRISPIKKNGWKVIGYKIEWWYDKDIGIEYMNFLKGY